MKLSVIQLLTELNLRVKDGHKIRVNKDSQISVIRDNFYLLHYLVIKFENGMTIAEIAKKFPKIHYHNIRYFFKIVLEIEPGRHSNRRYEIWNQIQKLKPAKKKSMEAQFELYKLIYKLDE